MRLTLKQRLTRLHIGDDAVAYGAYRITRIENTTMHIHDTILERERVVHDETIQRVIVRVTNACTGANDPLPCRVCGFPSVKPTCAACAWDRRREIENARKRIMRQHGKAA